MSAKLLALLVQMTLATSVAVVFIAVVRKALRGLFGTLVSYWIWAAAPATAFAQLVSALLPVDSFPEVVRAQLALPLQSTLPTTISRASSLAGTYDDALLILLAWLAGAAAAMTLFVYRQRSFMKSLGQTHLDPNGMLRSDRVTTPMLVGAWRARILLPTNFESLYSNEDRILMLMHERAHREKGDALANAFAVGWLCIFWFNPLMYWALGRFRFDQELACDAWVLSRAPADKRRYADALLNAQLKSESVRLMTVGCHWKPNHPLKERIAMLNHASPTVSRRVGGAMLTIGLVAFSAFASFAGFAESPRTNQQIANGAPPEPKIAVDAQDMNTRDVLEMIARKGHQNVLVSDKVTGKITVHLKDVTPREALHIVALSQGLVATRDDNITIVDTAH